MRDAKERKIYRILPCYRNDILAIEAWLEDMAAEGYMLKKFNGIILRPGEIFSYWRLIGNPSRRKGYVEGMI